MINYKNLLCIALLFTTANIAITCFAGGPGNEPATPAPEALPPVADPLLVALGDVGREHDVQQGPNAVADAPIAGFD